MIGSRRAISSGAMWRKIINPHVVASCSLPERRSAWSAQTRNQFRRRSPGFPFSSRLAITPHAKSFVKIQKYFD
jgi:hypothetical protein